MSILDSAELLVQAKNYSGSGNWLDEANSHNTTTLGGALFKAFAAEQYVFLPGTAGNYLSTPDAAALGLHAARAYVNVGTWT